MTKQSNPTRTLDISWSTILRISVAILVLYLLYLIKDLLVWFIFALIISVLFEPAVNFLHRKKVPRLLAVILIYVGAFGLISLVIYLTIPLFISEIQQFSQVFSQYFEKISPPLAGLGIKAFENLESFLNAVGGTLEGMAANIFSSLFAIFGGIFSTIFIISLSLFLSLEENAVERTLAVIFPEQYKNSALNLWERCRKKVTAWFGVRILASLFVGILCYIVFLLFGVKYPFSLALLAGVLEIIPVLGPLFTGIIAFLLVALNSMARAIFVLAFLILVQQIEGHIVTPALSKKLIGLPPALILMALAIGGHLWGIMGAILAIPLAGILFEFLRDFLKKRKEAR